MPTEETEPDPRLACDGPSLGEQLEQLSSGFQKAVSKLSAFVAESHRSIEQNVKQADAIIGKLTRAADKVDENAQVVLSDRAEPFELEEVVALREVVEWSRQAADDYPEMLRVMAFITDEEACHS